MEGTVGFTGKKEKRMTRYLPPNRHGWQAKPFRRRTSNAFHHEEHGFFISHAKAQRRKISLRVLRALWGASSSFQKRPAEMTHPARPPSAIPVITLLSFPMILNDLQIIRRAREGMIEPFSHELVCAEPNGPILSYGLSSYGYDLRLSPREFKIFQHIPGTIVDPKRFNPENLKTAPLLHDDQGDYFILPSRSYGLGVAVEELRLPENVSALCIGKSTYARCGIIANVTPAEAGWRGHLTLEFSNSSAADCRVYAMEGVVQMIFFQGEPCATSYPGRRGKYHQQTQHITLPRV
jgi:dCTP deaminase